jgi:GAF domain-containing protein
MGLTHSCLFELHQDNRFNLTKSNFGEGSALSEKVRAFSWQSLQKHISPTEPTYLQHEHTESPVFDELSSSKEPLKAMLFVPVRYREQLLGFLAIFIIGDMAEPSHDTRMLLQILALQISHQLLLSQQKKN